MQEEFTKKAQGPEDGNFFKKLRNGDFGLFKTYWLYGVGVGVVANIIGGQITSNFGLGTFGVIYSLYGTQTALGLWRSAKKYQGRKLWAVFGRIVAVFSWIAVITLIFISLLLFVSEWANTMTATIES